MQVPLDDEVILDSPDVRPADLRVFVSVAVGAAAVDLALRSGVAGVGGLLAVTTAAAALLLSGRLANPQARGLAVAALLFAFWLPIRTSPWLLPLDIVAAAGLLALAASFASGGSVLDVDLGALVARGLHAVAHATVAGAVLFADLAESRRRARAEQGRTAVVPGVLRGLALAAPVVLVLGILLASADVVFARFFRFYVDPNELANHLLALAGGGWAMAALLRVASARPAGTIQPVRAQIGRVELFVVVVAVDALFGLFAVAQLVALSEGGRRIIETAGLTYAEYARSGFFQLLAVATMTLLLLLGLRALTPRADRRSFSLLAGVAIVLTLVIVLVSVRRMNLYEGVFGLTMLRLYSKLFAFWIAAVFVLLAMTLAGAWRSRAWFVPGAAAGGLLLLFALNVANPEAVVVRHNVARAVEQGKFDSVYLTGLSEDAVPTLVASLQRLGPTDRELITERLCPPASVPWHGWAAYNFGRERAQIAVAPICATQSSAAAVISGNFPAE